MSGSQEAARELGRFLRSRRERISPEEVGLILAGRRRTPGLRREEVAVLAGLSTTWYTYIEQGRGREVSPSVLDSVARALHLTEDERRYIHTLAYGKAPGAPADERHPYDAATAEALKQIVAGHASYPYPVYMVDHVINMMAWNEAAKTWYTDWDDLPADDCNFLSWLLTHRQAKAACVDWEDVAVEIIARWRLQLAKLPPRKDVTDFIGRLRMRSPEFSVWWDERDVREHRVSRRRLYHPRHGTQLMRVIYLKTAYGENPAVIFHLPELVT